MTASELAGRCLAGRYRLVEMIGSGGAGNVWAAVDEVLGRRVAVKDVGAPPWLSAEGWSALRERTLREARAAAVIGHPNVVTVYDVVEEDDRPWIVMQLFEARTLAQLIDDEGPCTPRRAAEIGLQVLAALRAAHAHGILHRDVKPSNVLLCGDGRAVLTDFGIAAVDGDAALTQSGVLVGAPSYIAPERVRDGVVGPESDLWSLGALLYAAAEGRPPYRRDGAISTIAAAVHEDPDPASRIGPLAPLVNALLDRDPQNRPTADDTELFLCQVAAGGSPQLTAPVVVAEPTAATQVVPAAAPMDRRELTEPISVRTGGTRTRGVALLAAVAIAIMAILCAGYFVRHTLEPGSPTPGTGDGSEPAGPQPVAEVELGDQNQDQPLNPGVAVPPAGVGRPAATSSSSLQPSTVLTQNEQPSLPPASGGAATTTTEPEPEPTTTAEPPPTTTEEPPTSPSGAAVTPSVLP